MLNLVE